MHYRQDIYLIWLYPIPNLVALAGWIFVFATSDVKVILFGLGSLALGIVVFLLWSKVTKRWPFAAHADSVRAQA